MSVKIILKNSNVEDKRPSVSQLENGEIALNYNEAGAFLTCKDTNGDIQQVGGVKINETAPDSPPIQCLWFQPSSLTLFVYDGDSWLPVAGGGGGGGTPGTGITQIIGNQGIDADEIAGIVTLDVELDGTNCGLKFNSSKLSAEIASDSKLGSVKIGDGIDVAIDGTISVDIPQTLTFRGSVDLNNPPSGQITPDPAVSGDAYVVTLNAPSVANGWTGIVGDSAIAGDLVVYNGTEWELISTGGTMQGVEGGAGITSTTSGGVATVAVDAGTGLSFDGDDKLIVDLDSGDLDGRYLRIDAGTFDQTVASTGDTTFSGLTKHANGITLTGNDFKVLGSNSTAKIFPGFNNSSPKSVTVSAVFPKVNSTTLKNFTLYNAAFDESSPNAALNEIVGYRAAGTLSGSGAGEAYGFYSELESVDGKQNFNFYAGEDAPNFFQGDTHIGGSISTTTRELWESTLTDEQKEELAAGTLIVPANVAIPADGEFARQWYYNQQDAETQALLDSGELEYPTHLAAATFTDTFALGDNTNINLNSNGLGEFKGGVKVSGGSAAIVGQGIWEGLFGLEFADENQGVGFLGNNRANTAAAISGVTKDGPGSGTISTKRGLLLDTTIKGEAEIAVSVFNDPDLKDLSTKNFVYYTARTQPDNLPDAGNEFLTSICYEAFLNTDLGTQNAYGFYSELIEDLGRNLNFFAAGTAPNFFKGDTYIGGNITNNTFELWKSTLTEEQLEQLEAGTLVAPANVSVPGDGSFARAWYYDQQSAEDQALLDSGELEYPEHFAAATFTDNFALGDNTRINLNSDGTSRFKRDVEVGINNSNGIVLTSPGGNKFRLIVDNAGNLSTVAV